MNFYPWTTDYDNYCRQVGKIDHQQFLTMRLAELRQHRMPAFRLLMESYWHDEGRPYYNVHPHIAPKLARVNLEKIPSHLIVAPEPFHAVHIALAEPHDELTLASRIEADHHAKAWSRSLPPGAFVKGIMMADLNRWDFSCGRASQSDQIMFCLDFGVRTSDGHASYIVFTIYRDAEHNLAESIEGALDEKRDESYRRVCTNALRLAVTIGFMANSRADLIEPDVLSKLRNDYADACRRGDETRKSNIVSKSHRRGKIGFNVGNDLLFLGHRRVQGEAKGPATGRELQYQHLRDGHPHAVRHGEGKKLVKIMWFQPTQVRPDLPFKPEEER